MVYFAVTIKEDQQRGRGRYDEYIRQVKPIVESYSGRYIIRSEKIMPLADWQPDRFILIEFPSREQLESCFNSEEYHQIAQKRILSVTSQAIIIEEDGKNENF